MKEISIEVSKELLQKLGHKFKVLREQRNLTPKDISFHTGIDASDVTRIETGKLNITFRTFCKLVAVLDIHPRELFDFEFEIDKFKSD